MNKDMLSNALEMLADNLSRVSPVFLYPGGRDSGAEELSDFSTPLFPSESHIDSEMVMLIEGRAVLLGGKRHYELQKGRLFIITPGTVHAESYYSQREPYKVLWIENRPNILHFFISAYDIADGGSRRSSHDFRLEPMLAKELWLLCSKGGGEVLDANDRRRVQAYALLATCETLESYQKGLSIGRKEYGKAVADQISTFICHNFSRSFSIKDLAKLVRLSPNYLNALFKREIGKSLYAFLLDTRLEHASGLLKATGMPVKEIAASCGFTDPLYFCRIFKKKYGRNPTLYRRKRR